MKSVEKTGRTVDEAILAAIAELGVPKSECRVEILAEPSRGFLGILGSKEARVRVTAKESKVELAKAFVAGVLERMNTEAAIEVRPRGDTLNLDIVGRDMGLLIGRRGDTLRALEFLTNLASSKGAGEVTRVLVDVSGYRKRRERDLEETAKSLARRVVRTGESVTTEAMDARDRRIIHLALQDNSQVCTHSEGEEPFRRVVISLRDRPGSEEPVS